MRGITEKGCHGVVVLGGKGIELMIVALGAIGSQAKIDPSKGLDAVGSVVGQIFFRDRPAFIGGYIASLESRRDELVEGGLREKVSRKLPDCKIVVGNILVERTYHPVAIRMHLPVVVKVEAVSVSVASRIQPIASAMLSIVC